MIYLLIQTLSGQEYKCGQTASLSDAQNWKSKSPNREIAEKEKQCHKNEKKF